MTAIHWSFLTFVSTFAGGLCALRVRDRLHLVLGFSAGVLLGVVSFDILPEIFELRSQHPDGALAPMVALVTGFLLFHALERFVLVHTAHEGDYAAHRHPRVGKLAALALIGHSFLDGVGIGVAFQVSPSVGLTVAIAVIAHDFCDGLNTVGLMLTHGNNSRSSVAMLALDALAPIAGASTALALAPGPGFLALSLGGFAGFLLYIATSDILPQAHSRGGPKAALRLIGTTVLGTAFIYVVVRAS